MDLGECKRKVQDDFPFPGYIENALDDVVVNMVTTITNYLDRGSRILDFASGPCDKTAMIQCLGYECSAYDDLNDDWHRKDDNINKIIDFAHKCNIDFRLAENGHLPFPEQHYDMVMAHDVIEHLHDSPKELLNDLCELLKPNGLLFITVPNAVNIKKRLSVLIGKTNLPAYETYYWYPSPWRGHVREYVKNDLDLLAQYLGLEILELRGCHHMLRAVPSKIKPIYMLLTKIFPGLRDSWTLVARKPVDWTPNRTISEKEFNRIIGRYSPYYRSQDE